MASLPRVIVIPEGVEYSSGHFRWLAVVLGSVDRLAGSGMVAAGEWKLLVRHAVVGVAALQPTLMG